jgi:mono/diheme cytochrome c family protein
MAQAEGAKEIYEAKCKKCHGVDGDGKGRSGRSLKVVEKDPKALELNDKAAMAKFTDEDMAKSIKSGGEAINKSKEMEAYPNLTDAEIKSLVEYIKTFAK